MTTHSNGLNPVLADLAPTTASEWRKAKEEGYTIPLPSGNKATIRPIALDLLVKNGEIPDVLTPAASKALWIDTEADTIASNPEFSRQFIDLIYMIVPLAMLKPKVVETPRAGKEEITMDDIDFADKVAIFNLSIQPASVLKSFRDESAKRLETLHDSESDEQ